MQTKPITSAMTRAVTRAVAAGGSGGVPGFPINGVDFNWSSDSAGAAGLRFDSLSGINPGGAGTMIMSAWLYRGDVGVARPIFAIGTSQPNLIFQITAANKFRYDAQDSLGVTANSFVSSGDVPGAEEWFHVLYAIQAGAEPKMYLNDAPFALTRVSTGSNNNISWQAFYPMLGLYPGFSGRWRGAMAQFYLASEQYLDIDVEENRRKFINPSAKPVDLGPTGALPTGGAAKVFFDNPAVSWITNRGTGGAFALLDETPFIDASTNPPV